MGVADDENIESASTMAALAQTRASLPPSSGGDAAPEVGTSRRFERVRRLGTGGMGVVDCVWDGDLLRELAFKRVRPELRDDARVIAMFLWEARVTAYLDHPNIVPVHDLGRTAGGDPYFAMKRVVGVSLDDVVRRLRAGDPDAAARWTLSRRLRLLHQLATAIGFAHGRGVLHRDLKPGNIMLGEAGEVMVMDWGLAVPMPGDAGERLRALLPAGIDTASAGTPLYMSPEQARGEALDERSDVYALGIMLYELATLARPYGDVDGRELIERVSRGATRPVREASREVSTPLAAVIECATRADRTDRYATVRALADDLERLIDGKSPAAEHATGLRQAARFYMSHDRRLAKLRVIDIDLIAGSSTGFGVAIGALVAGGGWWWIPLVAAVIAAVRPIRSWYRAGRDGEL